MKSLEQYIERPYSVLLGRGTLEPLHSLKHVPVFFGCVDTPAEDDIVADMDWAIDPETGMVQLTRLVPPEILYRGQHFDGFGPTWKAYYEDLAGLISSFSPKVVLEIGGGMGVLAQQVTAMEKGVTWHIVEPNPDFKPTDRIHVHRGFFDENTPIPKGVDMIVFSQVMEHVYDPEKFIQTIAAALPPKGMLVFGHPNLLWMLQQKYTNALNFEHTMLITDAYVDPILVACGFRILVKRLHRDQHFFYAAELSGDERKEGSRPQFPNCYQAHKKAFLDFVEYHEGLVQRLNAAMEAFDGTTYLFGAHIFSTYLIAFGLDTSKVSGILDNSPNKQGRRMYGTKFLVASPSILKGEKNVQVILKAGIYNEEIRKDILTNINQDVLFI